MIFLLTVSIVLFVRSEIRSHQEKVERDAYKKFMIEQVMENERVLNQIKAQRDTLDQNIKDNKVIVITKQTSYETIKKSSPKTNYSSSDITNWLQQYGSNQTGGGEGTKKN